MKCTDLINVQFPIQQTNFCAHLRLLMLLAVMMFSSGGKTCLAGFTDVTQTANVDYLQWSPLPGNLESMRITGGAAAGDLNGDGYPDLFVSRLDAPDLVFLNDRNGAFTQSDMAGLSATRPSNGVAMGDVDNDGDQDVYVTSVGDTRHYLYINDGTGRFQEEGIARHAAIDTGLNHIGMSTAMGDVDNDGYLDLHVTEWGNVNYTPEELYSHVRLLRNQGQSAPGYFEDITETSRLVIDQLVGYSPTQSRDGAWTFTSTIADFDRDGHADVAVVGDFHTSRLYWNNGDGTFKISPGPDTPNPAGLGTDENGMGSAVADVNGDGYLDWFVTAIYDPREPCFENGCHWNGTGNRLYLNNGDRTFSDITDQAGVRDGAWGWGAVFFDYDNDGDEDLAMTNGMIVESELAEPFFTDPMRLWRNNGDGTYSEVAELEGLNDTGAGKGLLTLDYDMDGDLDVFVVNNGEQPKLYRNDNDNGNSFLKVDTEGTVSNRDGVGAFVTLLADPDSQPQLRYVTGGGSNYLSQSDQTVHFGLGPRDDAIHELRIDWPSGVSQVFRDVPINTTLLAREPVPEPSAVVITLCGIAFAMTRVRRRIGSPRP